MISRRSLLFSLVANGTTDVRFTDVAAQAGLARARNVSGHPINKQFILEEMGCGVALFDYDNDGWLDIFLVNGSSFDPAVRAAKLPGEAPYSNIRSIFQFYK